jgi:8-oxo-dGTP diphosphatase
MVHRISCGALVVREGKILLVRHVRPNRYDFWAAPGGGVEGSEELEAAAEREVLEETGLVVRASRLAYIDHLWNQTDRTVKFWFLADYVSGERNVSANPAEGEFIVAAEWFPLDTLPAGHVFPEPLRERFRDDLTIGFPAPIRLPLRELLF